MLCASELNLKMLSRFLPAIFSSGRAKCFSLRPMTTAASQVVKVSSVGEQKKVKLITLDDQKRLNALSLRVFEELDLVLDDLEKSDECQVIILTGSGRSFIAGANLKEMAEKTHGSMLLEEDIFKTIKRLDNFKKPVIAAVNGFALGGGCEVAMMCDIIYASKNALFGQPEIKIGTLPGLGGTQRLPKLVGKSKAMEMILTGDPISADEAHQFGIVSKVVEPDELIPAVVKVADKIASYSPLIVRLCKEAVLKGYDLNLTQGLYVERQIFDSTFATNDRKEGMTAFVEKRKPKWTNS